MTASREQVAGWLDMLGKIERALEHTLAVAPEDGGGPKAVRPVAAGALAQLDQRLEVWQSRLEQVERAAARAEAEIDSDLAALRDWSAAASQVREALLARPQSR